MITHPRLLIGTVLLAGFAVVGHGDGTISLEGSPRVPQQPLFTTRSELVVLHVTVTDRRGAYVSGLPADAFTVFEDGRQHTIQFFGQQDAPVTVGLLIDSSGSMLLLRARVVEAAGAFAETSNPADEIFALVFNDTVSPALPASAPFTGSAETIRRALSGALVPRGRTALYDAVTRGLEYLNRGSHQTKALVIVSDGGDNASTATFAEVLRRTQVSNTVIYAIGFVDPADREANPKRLRQLADASGGEAFFPRDADVDTVLQRIARDIRSTYTIGYVPTSASAGARVRRLRVAVQASQGRLRVRTRQGYVLEEP
jgi:VWFA-related protein